MRFSTLSLANFRSFGPDKVEIAFPENENLMVVVGSNNAGKSNLVDAVRLALNAGSRFAPDPTDFHQLDVTREMRIELLLRNPLPQEDIFRGEQQVHGFYLRAWQSDRRPDRGQLKAHHYCLDGNGKQYNPPAAVGRRRRGAPLSPDAERIRFGPPAAATISRQLGRLHYLSPNLYRAFDTAGYGMLARLLDLYREDFYTRDNTYQHESWPEPRPAAQAYERLADKMIEVLRTETLVKIESSLSSNLALVLGPSAAGAEVTLTMPTAEELLRTALRLRVQDDEHSPVLPVERLGAGYQSLLRLAILRTFAELAPEDRPGVFLIEEPEAYLNPHLRRFLRTTLDSLAAAGNQIIVTTHDAAFVSLPEYRTIARVGKVDGVSVAFRCREALSFDYERVAQKLRTGGNGEVLFSQRAILCEGQDDAGVVRALLDRLGSDPDSRSISVVDCGSRDNLPDYIQLLDQLGIDLLVVTDGDQTTGEKDERTRKKAQRVADLAGERAVRFTEDLETALGTIKQKANLPHLLAQVEQLDMASPPEEIGVLIERLRDFCPPAETRDTLTSAT